MIVMDLEWNRGYDRTPLDEILQIGAVRVERPGGPVLDSFNAYIRPSVHRKFDPGASSLPDLALSKTSHRHFPAVMNEFRAWCGEEKVFAFWGGGDFDILEKNCAYWSVPALRPEKVYDFQRAFSYILGTTQQIALGRAVEYCRIPDIFSFHNALNDALYTALVGAWLTQEALDYKPDPAASLRLCTEPFPPQPRQRVGPFPTAAEVLNARSSRNPPCPLCGKKGCVLRWHFPKKGGQPRHCFAIFSCPEHGRFLCRLTLIQGEDGGWRGRRSVPALTPELLQEYAAALKGEVCVCKSARRRRRRSRTNPDRGTE